MAKRVSNPPNPWASSTVEWLEEPPEAPLEVFEERAKSVLSKNDSPDVPFRFSVNPYRGCQHACAYCYARPTHQYLSFGAGTDFERKIVVKTNAPELLRKALAKPSWKGEAIVFSGNTDCYQPLEASYGLTRRCLEVCRDFSNPVSIITKAALIRRDAELLAEIHRRARVSVFLSCPFADDGLARTVEPSVSAPSKRFEAMKVLADAGVPTSLFFSPLIPGLNEEQIPEALRLAKENGARGAYMTLLRLAAETRTVFHERIEATLPLRAEKIRSAIEDMRRGQGNRTDFGTRMRGSGERWKSAVRLFQVQCRKLGLETSEEEPRGWSVPKRRKPVQGRLFEDGDAGFP